MLSTALKQKTDSLLKAIATELFKKHELIKEHPAVQNGVSGVSLFLYEYGKVKRHKKFSEKGQSLIISCLDRQSDQARNTSFFLGPAGTYWCARHMKIPINKLKKYQKLKSELIENMYQAMKYDGLYELAHGATGWGIFSEVLSGDDYSLNQAVRVYLTKTQKMRPRHLWTLPPMYEDSGKVAWGYAHGVLAPLVWLNNKSSARLIYKELQDTFDRPNPGIEGSKPKGSAAPQSAWCYGDAAIGYAFSHLSMNHPNKKFSKLGSELFLRGISGEPPYRKVNEMGLCHGKGGALLLSVLHYKMTGEERSLNSAHYWLNQILEDSEFDMQEYPIGLMNGLSGLGLALLELYKKEISSWPRILMLV